MVTQACQVAASKGVRHLYVHVVASNEPALRLYENQCGFEIEQREDESFARALNRPRRLLLHREL
jgi:ribosomal protein S18 acetylase RimI-like enzyme